MVKILILIIFLIAGCAGDTRNDIKNNKNFLSHQAEVQMT